MAQGCDRKDTNHGGKPTSNRKYMYAISIKDPITD